MGYQFMRQWVKQPSGTKTCGQVAVAVIAGISLEEAIKVVGKKGCTTTKDLVKAIRKLGFKCPDRCKKMNRTPPLAIAQVKYPTRKSGWHWVVVDGNKIFDGQNGNAFGVVQWGHDWRMTSFLSVSLGV